MLLRDGTLTATHTSLKQIYPVFLPQVMYARAPVSVLQLQLEKVPQLLEWFINTWKQFDDIIPFFPQGFFKIFTINPCLQQAGMN
jgi:hypothetical protein